MSLKWRDYHDEQMQNDPEYRREYEALEGEFALARRVIEERTAPAPTTGSSPAESPKWW